MFHEMAATAVLVLHCVFIVFVLFGGLLAARWRWCAAIHLPAAAWGFLVEMTGAQCPLTSLEDELRLRAGQAGNQGDFIGRLLASLIYPAALTREVQYGLAAGVVLINVLIYGALVARRFRSTAGPNT